MFVGALNLKSPAVVLTLVHAALFHFAFHFHEKHFFEETNQPHTLKMS